MKLWKPSNRKERWIGTGVLWFSSSAIVNIFGMDQDNDFVIAFFSIFLVAATVYIWKTKSDNYDSTQDDLVINRRKSKAARKENALKERGISFATTTLRYYGGGLIEREKDVVVDVTSKGLYYGNEFISLDKINGVNLETQSQLRSRITVTKMALFGIFALAAPKRKSTTEKFLAIDYDNGFSSTLIFGGKQTTKIQAALIKVKSQKN